MIPLVSGDLEGGGGKPRASGDDPHIVRFGTDPEYVNPARAGMIRPSYHSSAIATSKPRASGDDPEGGRAEHRLLR